MIVQFLLMVQSLYLHCICIACAHRYILLSNTPFVKFRMQQNVWLHSYLAEGKTCFNGVVILGLQWKVCLMLLLGRLWWLSFFCSLRYNCFLCELCSFMLMMDLLHLLFYICACFSLFSSYIVNSPWRLLLMYIISRF